jgi:hypothetical protein
MSFCCRMHMCCRHVFTELSPSNGYTRHNIIHTDRWAGNILNKICQMGCMLYCFKECILQCVLKHSDWQAASSWVWIDVLEILIVTYFIFIEYISNFVSCYDHCNEALGSIKGWAFFTTLKSGKEWVWMVEVTVGHLLPNPTYRENLLSVSTNDKPRIQRVWASRQDDSQNISDNQRKWWKAHRAETDARQTGAENLRSFFPWLKYS